MSARDRAMSAMTVPEANCEHMGCTARGSEGLAMLIEVLSERLARGVRHTLNHEVQCLLRGTDRTHAVMDASWAVQKQGEIVYAQTRTVAHTQACLE